jgi:hypothetical protein
VDNRHVPANCPLLSDLNLNLVCGPPPAATPPGTTPAPGAPVASSSGRLAMADNSSAANLTGQTTAPSGLVAALAEEEFASDKEFCMEGYESGLDYTAPSAGNSNNNVLFTFLAFVPLLNISHAQWPLFLIQPCVLRQIPCTLHRASTPIASWSLNIFRPHQKYKTR